MWTCAGLLAFIACASAITRDQFYPYGHGLDQRLPRGEVSSPETTLKVPIVFYGETYETIFVNNYGLLTFRADVPTFLNSEFPLPYPSIAAFYANVDTSESGAVYYRESDEPHILIKAEESVQNNFHDYYDFKPSSVFIATWEEVTYTSPQNSDRKNSFQIAVISNGTESFVEFLYPERDIQWIQREVQRNSLPDAKAQAGFVAENGRVFTLRGSGSHQIRNIVSWSNTQEPGKYVFRVGNIPPEGNVAPPDQYNENEIEIEEESKTCAQSGPSVCHFQAKCVDYQAGICCQCDTGFYGNGKSCIKDDVPLRVHGKLNGIINEVSINDVDIQSYVVVADGRSYTALSQAPPSLGSSLQVLNVLGGVIGWLFAKPSGTAKNGYQLTGSLFNHTADVFFPASGDRVTVNQEFSGHDVFDQITLESDIRGSIPVILNGVKLDVGEYQEQYNIVEPGLIRSDSIRTFTNKINGQTIEQRVAQTITYNPCRFAPPSEETTIPSVLKVVKNYLGFESKDNIVRYGMSNKIVPIGQEDPCITGRNSCGTHSNCIVQGDSFKCVCETGYTKVFTNEYDACTDIDECTAGTHNCDANADCYNHDGGFQCRCRQGFEGNGVNCNSLSTCSSKNCSPNARCVENFGEEPICVCNPGFNGDGQSCVPYDYICSSCSPYAYCTLSGPGGTYICQCNAGYTGDGLNCVEDKPYLTTSASTSTNNESEYNETVVLPNCDAYGCTCPLGYISFQDERNNNLCRIDTFSVPNQMSENNDTSIRCYTDTDCPPNAHCSFLNESYSTPDGISVGHCFCPEGYEGDAYECIEKTNQYCLCGPNARCINPPGEEEECVCDTGYHGDGYTCRPNFSCTNDSDCEYHAECRPDAGNNEYVCQCKEGYVKDQNDACIPDGQLCNGAVCPEHASCLFDETIGIYYCHCDAGYEGEGISQCVPQGNTCDVANDCHPDAVCSPYLNSYQCVCRDGYIGNGYSCTPEINCRTNPYLCDIHASCLKSSDGYECECNSGYDGNGSHCELNARLSGDFLVASDGASVYKVPFQVTSRDFATPFNSAIYQIAVGIDVDCETGRIYWGDVVSNAIKRGASDGTSYDQFLINNVKSPEGISIDWSARNIFWTDSKKLSIEVANLDTKVRKVLFSLDGISNPRGIAVHPQRGKIFWSDWNRSGPKIEWANMDGSQRGIFLDETDVKLPNSLAIDWARDRLCYADAGYFNIKCVGIDTLERETIAANCSYPFGLAIHGDKFYWTDWKTLKIEYIDTLTQLKGQVPIATASRRLYGVAVAPKQCPVGSNTCQYRNGNCHPQELCLPNGQGSRTCVTGDVSEIY